MEGSLSTREAAKLIGKSAHWLYINAQRLGVPRYRIGGQWVYLEDELEFWFTSQKVESDEVREVNRSGKASGKLKVEF